MEDPSVKTVLWEDQGNTVDAPLVASAPPRISGALALVPVVLVLVIGVLVVAGRDTARDLAEPVSPPQSQPATASPSDTAQSDTVASSTSTTLPSAPGTRAFAQFDGQVLGVNIGTSVVSTDFDGRMFALDLDTGILTRSRIRTGNFVTVAGRLVVQTGCGGWQVLDIPSFVLGDELIDCSASYGPLDQMGGQATIFAETGSGLSDDILVTDGEGGLTEVRLGDDLRTSILTASGGRVLIDRGDGQLAWIDPATNTTEEYAAGRVLAASPNGVLWSDSCDPNERCLVWFGTPDDPTVHPFPIEPFDLDQPARINTQGTRAVFFKPDGVLRIITTETGHARELENPGITASSATWSPDGLWLLETSGTEIVALNTLNGRVFEFEGIPGDFSPGWIALPITG